MDLLRYAHFTIAVILLLLGWGIWRVRRTDRRAARLLGCAWLLLWLVSWKPFAMLMIGTLEWQTPVLQAGPSGEQAIVVLSSGVYRAVPARPAMIGDLHSYVRCRHAAWLYHHGWRLPVVVSGGDTVEGQNLASAMAEMVIGDGVDKGNVWLEAGSTSTYENARRMAALLSPRGIRRILLVTEASHMPRARGVFRKAGFDIVPSPCFYRTGMFQGTWADWIIPTPQALAICEEAIHEWIGLGLYRLKGRL